MKLAGPLRRTWGEEGSRRGGGPPGWEGEWTWRDRSEDGRVAPKLKADRRLWALECGPMVDSQQILRNHQQLPASFI